MMKRLGFIALLITFLAPLALQATVVERSIPIAGSELLESGVVAAGSEGRIVTVLGSQRDTAKYLGKPGYNVLKVPDSEWSAKLNIKWLDGAIRRGDEIRFVTDPVQFEQLMIDLDKKSQFIDLEIPYLKWRGVMDTVTKGF